MTMRVYHLTSQQWALEALQKRRLKLSLLDDMNDPFELLAVALNTRKDRVDFRQLKAALNREIGVLCFSRSWSNPVLWSHYGERHKGICLGFDVPSELIDEVTYTNERFDPGEEETLSYRLLTTKYEHWRYENEVRIVIRLHGIEPESGHYFIPFSGGLCLREIVTGPRSELSIQDVRQFIDEKDQDVVTVTQSRLAFQSFKVVKNLAAYEA